MLSSLAKYDKFAKLKHVDSKKQLFVRGVYSGSPGPPPTSSPNRRLERGRRERLGGRLGERLGERLEGRLGERLGERLWERPRVRERMGMAEREAEREAERAL